MDMEQTQESGQALATVLIVAALVVIGWGVYMVALRHPSHEQPSVANVEHQPRGVFPPPEFRL